MLQQGQLAYPELSIAVPTLRSLIPVIFGVSRSTETLIFLAGEQLRPARPIKPLFGSPPIAPADAAVSKLIVMNGQTIFTAARSVLKDSIREFKAADVVLLIDTINSQDRLDDTEKRRALLTGSQEVADVDNTTSVISCASSSSPPTHSTSLPAMSPFSRQERNRYEAMWDSDTADAETDRQRLSDFIDLYEKKVGLQFVTNVKSRRRREIICEIEVRLDEFGKGTPDSAKKEFQNAIDAISDIAWARWEQMKETLEVPQ